MTIPNRAIPGGPYAAHAERLRREDEAIERAATETDKQRARREQDERDQAREAEAMRAEREERDAPTAESTWAAAGPGNGVGGAPGNDVEVIWATASTEAKAVRLGVENYHLQTTGPMPERGSDPVLRAIRVTAGQVDSYHARGGSGLARASEILLPWSQGPR